MPLNIWNLNMFFKYILSKIFKFQTFFTIVQTVLELFNWEWCLKICHICAFLTFKTRNVEILQLLKHPYFYAVFV